MYVVPAVVLWVCTFESGVHATIAGVVLGLLTPARPFGGREVIEELERGCTRGRASHRPDLRARQRRVVPGARRDETTRWRSPIAWGIVIGLVVGKPLGIIARDRARSAAAGSAGFPMGSRSAT